MAPKRLLCVIFATLLGCASAFQIDDARRLQEVVVEGTTTYADIVRVVLGARAGTPTGEIDLEAERNRVYALGTFEEVSVALEERNGGPALVVRVVENPLVGEVAFEGATAVDPQLLRDALEREHLLAAGRVYNTARAEEAFATIQAIYRQRGFPFTVPVTLDVQAMATEDGAEAVRLLYGVDEAAPVSEVRVSPSTVLDQEALEGLFRPLLETGSFDVELFQRAVQEVERRYRQQGYRLSGVDLSATELTAGLLDVQLREARIASIDTSALGVGPEELSLEVGDLFNYDVLVEDVERLAAGREGDVRLVAQPNAAGDARVRFELGPPDTAGPITEVVIEGNTVIPDEELLPLLELEVVDTFTSTVAQEDFQRILERYAQEGWVVLTEPDFNYLDGTYVQRVHEVRLGGYQVTFEDGAGRTEEFVVTRYLPEIGEVINENDLRASLRQIARVGAVEPVNVTLLPGGTAEEAILEVLVREGSTGLFTPSLQYSTETGLSASVSFSEANLLGRAHALSAELTAQTTDVGLMFGGVVRYSVPWLYLDVLDFQEVPTSVSASAFSLVSSNRILTSGGETSVPYPGFPDIEPNRVLVGEYTQRETGLSLAVARPVLPNTTLRFSSRAAVTNYKLEPPEVECEFGDDGELLNAELCALPREQALQYLPQGGLSSFSALALTYDSRDSLEFPRRGVYAFGQLGLGLGTDYRDPVTRLQRSYVYEEIEFGARTYLQLSELAPLEITDPNHVLAFKINAGHQFGGDYPASKRFQVGKTTNEATAVRGFRVGDFGLSQTYATGSVEYRYDFGLDTFATQTVIGILFADVAYVSNVPGFPEYGAPLFASAGVGLQLNLGFGGVQLPALRFDYGFSERNPTGEFRFRIGPVF